jgi:hypothetical protein
MRRSRKNDGNKKELEKELAKRDEGEVPKKPAKTVFLSALSERNVKVAGGPDGPYFATKGRLPRIIWREKLGDNERISFNGVRSPNAIFMHPEPQSFASVTYDLKNPYTVFRAKAHIVSRHRQQGNPVTPLTFEVLGDGKTLWKSKPLTKKGQSRACEVKITGVRVLELRVNCPGPHDWAWSVWIEPRLN